MFERRLHFEFQYIDFVILFLLIIIIFVAIESYMNNVLNVYHYTIQNKIL